MTIRGEAFRHLLFEWVLSYSRWTYVSLALSETFEALVAGLQGALWTLGAVPAVLRHDNLSAATHELKRSGGRQLTVRFQAGAGPLRAALVADPAGEAAREVDCFTIRPSRTVARCRRARRIPLRRVTDEPA